MTEVEIIWPAALDQDRLDVAADEFTAAGVETTCRIQPVRRGAETAVLILMTTSAMEPFLKVLFERIGEGAYDALKRFVGKLFGDDSGPNGKAPPKKAPDVVIFEATASGAQFLFTAGLPGEAYQEAIELGAEPEPGRWMWNTEARSWLRFEGLSQ